MRPVSRCVLTSLLSVLLLMRRSKVARSSPESFWPFSLALFKRQGEYFDIPTSTLTPLQIREKLAALAAEVVPTSVGGNFADLLVLKSSPNGGNAVTDDLKYTSM